MNSISFVRDNDLEHFYCRDVYSTDKLQQLDGDRESRLYVLCNCRFQISTNVIASMLVPSDLSHPALNPNIPIKHHNSLRSYSNERLHNTI